MKYYELETPDNLRDTYVFRRLISDRIVLRERYRGLECSSCGKFDEASALKTCGIDDDVLMNAKCDLRFSCDEFLLVSNREFDRLQSRGVLGLQELARNEHVVVAMPELMPVSASFRFEEHSVCPRCSRPRERIGIPRLADIQLPPNERTVFGYEPPNEGRLGRIYAFYTAEASASELKTVKGARLARRR